MVIIDIIIRVLSCKILVFISFELVKYTQVRFVAWHNFIIFLGWAVQTLPFCSASIFENNPTKRLENILSLFLFQMEQEKLNSHIVNFLISRKHCLVLFDCVLSLV